MVVMTPGAVAESVVAAPNANPDATNEAVSTGEIGPVRTSGMLRLGRDDGSLRPTSSDERPALEGTALRDVGVNTVVAGNGPAVSAEVVAPNVPRPKTRPRSAAARVPSRTLRLPLIGGVALPLPDWIRRRCRIGMIETLLPRSLTDFGLSSRRACDAGIRTIGRTAGNCRNVVREKSARGHRCDANRVRDESRLSAILTTSSAVVRECLPKVNLVPCDALRP